MELKLSGHNKLIEQGLTLLIGPFVELKHRCFAGIKRRFQLLIGPFVELKPYIPKYFDLEILELLIGPFVELKHEHLQSAIKMVETFNRTICGIETTF